MSASFSATGRRKTASARVTLVPGTGQITINKRAFEEYFGTLSMQNKVLHPFQVANVTNQFDAVIAANGGGVTVIPVRKNVRNPVNRRRENDSSSRNVDSFPLQRFSVFSKRLSNSLSLFCVRELSRGKNWESASP